MVKPLKRASSVKSQPRLTLGGFTTRPHIFHNFVSNSLLQRTRMIGTGCVAFDIVGTHGRDGSGDVERGLWGQEGSNVSCDLISLRPRGKRCALPPFFSHSPFISVCPISLVVAFSLALAVSDTRNWLSRICKTRHVVTQERGR
jgi:hypothetical protein